MSLAARMPAPSAAQSRDTRLARFTGALDAQCERAALVRQRLDDLRSRLGIPVPLSAVDKAHMPPQPPSGALDLLDEAGQRLAFVLGEVESLVDVLSDLA